MVLWIFGYGSLIWRPSFNYDDRVVGYIKGYRRVFHQACIDYRGTVLKPGRTLTLEEEEGAITWGVAYRVTPETEEQMVAAYLNQRERTYNVRALLEVYTADCSHTPAISEALTYIATPGDSNSWYLGPAPLREMAEQIAWSRGPAGPNYDYLFHLENALRQHGAECVDDTIVELANEVRKVLEVGKVLGRKFGYRRVNPRRRMDAGSEYRRFSIKGGKLRSHRLELPASDQYHSNCTTCNPVMVIA